MTVVELVRSPLELDPFTETEGSPDDADDGGLGEATVELSTVLEGPSPVDAPAGEDGTVDDVTCPGAVVDELLANELGPLVGSSEDGPMLDGIGEVPEEGAPDEAGHDEPQDPLGQGHEPVQEPVQELGHGVLDGEGRPLEVATVKLVSGAVRLALSADDEGEVAADSDEEMTGVVMELIFPDGETDGPVLKGIETEPGTEDEDEGVLSALLDTTNEVMLPPGEDEVGGVAGPVESDGIPELVPTPLDGTSPGDVLAGPVGALESQVSP